MTPLALAGALAVGETLAVEEDSVSAGPLGLLIIVLMGIATVLLIRNMSGRIKKLPPEFPQQPEQRPGPGDSDPRE